MAASHRYSFPTVREASGWSSSRTPDRVTRVVAVDADPMAADGLGALLARLPDMALVGSASGCDALALCRAQRPDLLVIDVGSLGAGGLALTRDVRAWLPDTRVLVLSSADDELTLFGALRAGAHGFVGKGAGRREITRALRAVADGEAVFGTAVAARVLAHFGAQAPALPDPLQGLSRRECEVLDLLAGGHGTKEIARRLFLSPKTVRNHIANVVAKRQLADRAHAIAYARQAGLGRSAS